MARKRKAHELSTPTSDLSAQSITSGPAPDLQPKVDWSTIDQRGNFDGFVIKAAKLKSSKEYCQPNNSTQKTDAMASRRNLSYKEAPLDANILQENPYAETDVSEIHCKIEPAREWESMQRYRKFTIAGETFQVNQFVFVKEEAEYHETPIAIPHWIAKVLEVRAGDAQHVYLRIYWAYRPEDLPGGRQPHHGECELIVSNHMDVIDALCVQGAASVVYWDDRPDSLTFDPSDQLYWRQSLDINKRKGGQITKLNTYCLDKKPSNPDEPLIQCPSCSRHLHAHCLEERAIEHACREHKIARTKVSGPKVERKQRGFFESKISTTPDGGALRLTVTDKRKGQEDRHWDVDVVCLLCNSIIARAIADVPAPTTPAAQTADHDNEAGNQEDNKGSNAAVDPDTSSSVTLTEKADLAISDVSTSAVITATVPTAEAPRRRGRPKGAKNKKRDRPPRMHEPIPHQAGNIFSSEESMPGMHPCRDREKGLITPDLIAHTPSTPMAAEELPTTLIQSSVRSIKRLLHRGFFY